MPPQVVENLLWFFTEPGDIVVDPFAGSGTTVDVAKAMGRRVWASDIRGNHYSPHLPIHKHDITTGWPDAAPGKADLVFLDPPYWKQASGRYSAEPNELAEMDLAACRAAQRIDLEQINRRHPPRYCANGAFYERPVLGARVGRRHRLHDAGDVQRAGGAVGAGKGYACTARDGKGQQVREERKRLCQGDW
jgi:hypothetical protein